MANNNQMTVHDGKAQPFSAFLNGKVGQSLITKTLNDPKRRMNFVSAIIPAVANNAAIAACDNASIISCALKGEALNLPHAQELGYYYMVPFKSKAKYDKQGNLVKPESSVATFILGYRGLIQLALRSGQYKRLNVTEVYACEEPVWDRFAEELHHKTCTDDECAASEVVGYYASFELVNGFSKGIYMSWEAVMRHACQYSHINRNAWDQYNSGKVSQRDMWQYSSKWYSDFDIMAKKTLIRQLLSKWGVMSLDMQQAFVQDQEYETVEDDSPIQVTVDSDNVKQPENVIDVPTAASDEPLDDDEELEL